MRASAASRSTSSWGGTRASSPPPRRSRGEPRPTAPTPQDRPAPHLIYLPEVPFSTDAFLADVEKVYAKLGRCQIAVSEGIRDASGAEIGPKLMRGAGRSRRARQCAALGLGRARRWACRSRQDGAHAERRQEPPRARRHVRLYPALLAACLAGRYGRSARGRTLCGRACGAGRRLGLGDHPPRLQRADYRSECARADLSAVARRTRHVPAEFISGSNDVSAAFYAYCRPLLGDLPKLERL